MTVAFRSIGTLASGTGNSAAVSTPSGFQSGDLLLAAFACGYVSGSGGVSFPTTIPFGWQTLGTVQQDPNIVSAVYYKIAAGTEGSSQTWSGWNISTIDPFTFRMMAFTGCDITTPIKSGEWGTSSAAQGAGSATQNHPSVTPSVAGSGVVLFRAKYVGSSLCTSTITSAGSPAGVNRANDNLTYPYSAIFTRDGGFSLAAQSYSSTYSGGGTNADNMWTIILSPPPAGPGDSVGVLMS